MAGEALLIGIDGGGSGCRVAIATPDLAIIARGHGGPANPTTDFAGTVASITAALEEACVKAGMSAADLHRGGLAKARTHLGLAGIMEPSMAARIAAALPFDQPGVSDDRETTLVGTLAGRDGCVAAIGTGSFAGILQGGVSRFVGGWGSVLGDEASGAWLGRRLLGHICAAQDGMAAQSDLTRSVLADFGGLANHIPAFAATARPSDFAALAPRIVEAAKAGDRVAGQLLQDGANWITRAAASLGLTANMPFCMIGGLASAYPRYLPSTLTAALTSPCGDAIDGALFLALNARN